MVVHEYLRIFVVMHKVIDYEYFMNDMEDYEIQTLSSMLEYVDYDDWRRTRILYHGIVSPYLKRPTTINKLMPLPGDDANEEHIKTITNEQNDVMRKKSKRLAEKMFKKHTLKKN